MNDFLAALLGLDLVGKIGDGAKGDWFGGFVGISGDSTIVAVGAAKNDGNGIDSGPEKIYKWDDGLLNYKQSGGNIALSSNGTTAEGSNCTASEKNEWFDYYIE